MNREEALAACATDRWMAKDKDGFLHWVDYSGSRPKLYCQPGTKCDTFDEEGEPYSLLARHTFSSVEIERKAANLATILQKPEAIEMVRKALAARSIIELQEWLAKNGCEVEEYT